MSIFTKRIKISGSRALNKPAADYTGTRITPGMIIRGDVEAHGDYVVADGRVFGNITSESSVSASSFICGDINASSAILNGAKLRGNISTESSINVSEKSIVDGDLTTNFASVSGKVNGSIHTDELLYLAETSLVRGNISAAELSSASGSRILGKVSVFKWQSHDDFQSEFYFNEYETEAADGSDN